MIVVGAISQLIGLVAYAIHHAGSAAASSESVFDLTRLPNAILFSGLMVMALGGVMMFAGPWLYANERTPGRNFAQVLVPLVAVASIAGCAAAVNKSEAKGNGAKGAVAAGATQTTAHDMSKMAGATPTTVHAHDMANMGAILTGTATGESPCEKAIAKPLSPGEVGNGSGGSASNTNAEGGHGGRGMVKQVPLTSAQRVLLKTQMTQARSVAFKYPTVKQALAAGYAQSTVYLPCIGAHYTNLALIGHFDPAAPSELLYDGTKPDSKIVGLSYLVFHANGPPEGFAGTNDHFHQHNANGGLCLSKTQGVIGGESMSAADCVKAGGSKAGKIMADIWMEHAWIVAGWECSWGVFSGECPELGGMIGGTSSD